MVKDVNFNEYQIKTIQRKVSLDFDTEFNSNSETKQKLHQSVINNLDVLIENSLDQGIKFYEINFLESIKNINTVCTEVEDTINFCKAKISMIEMIYLVIEKNDYVNFNVKCVLSTRTLANGNILSSIKDIFNQLNENIELKYLDGFNNIKNGWTKILIEKNYKFHRFAYFSKFHQKLYSSLAELEVTFFPECGFDLNFFENALDSDVKGISGEKNSSEKICINLLNLYLHQNNLYLLYDNIYKRIDKSTHSYKLWGSIDYFDSKNLQILKDLKKKYNIQLNKLDIQQLLISSWENVFENFIKKRNNYFNNIVYYQDVIEFCDGLYFLNQNDFFSFIEYGSYFSKLKPFGCSKYFNNNFKDLQILPPSNWFNCIHQCLVDEKQLNKFLFNLGSYFNSRIIKTKNKITVFSDFKNEMIVKIFLLGFDEKRSKDDLFIFEQQEDEKILVCNSCVLKDTKNLYNVMSLNTRNRKFKQLGNITFQFNEDLSNKMLDDKTFVIKLLIYTFTFSFCEKNILTENIIEQELAQIIIYCNNLFFSQSQKPCKKKLLLIDHEK